MDREKYFADKLCNGEWLSEEELDELVNRFDIDTIKAPENFIPVGFNGKVWMVPFSVNPLMIHQPVEAEEYEPGEWYPIKSRKVIMDTIWHERETVRIMRGLTQDEFSNSL